MLEGLLRSDALGGIIGEQPVEEINKFFWTVGE
jgi:hypothetical protein